MVFNSGLLSVIRRLRGPKTRISPRLDLSRHLPSEQPQSPFLSLLPFELRDIIYLFVLGNKHILLYGSIPPARRNTNTAQKNPDVWSCCFSEPVAGPQQTTEAHPSVALLCVCRQIYIEAHGILWRANTFHLSTRHLERILLAPGSLGHFGIAQVQNLVLTYVAFPYDREVFDERERECTLDVLRHFTRLKSLVVCFFGQFVDVYDSARHTVAYDPRSLLETAWGRRLCALSSLREMRFEFWFSGRARDVDDTRWGHLAEEIVSRAVGQLVLTKD